MMMPAKNVNAYFLIFIFKILIFFSKYVPKIRHFLKNIFKIFVNY